MTITQFITELPDAPDPASDSADEFSDKAAATVLAQKNMVPELNTFIGQANATALEVNNSAAVAAAAQVAALASEESAAASAASAIAAPGTNATSTTSLSVGSGTISLTIQTGKSFAGGWFTLERTSDRSKWMLGKFTSYNSGTGALVLAVAAADVNGAGSGPYTDWTLTQSASRIGTLAPVDLSLVGPSSLPTLLADFANSKWLPSGFVYTMASPQSYFDAVGVLRTAPPGVPAFDHDPITGQSLGIQLFEQRPNLLVRSEELDNAAWVKSGASVTANAAQSPDGATTADKLVEDNANTAHSARIDTPSQAAGTYTYSIFVKPSGRTQLLTHQVVVANYAVLFDLVAMTATSYFGGATGAIIPLKDGWYRLTMTFTSSQAIAFTISNILTNGASPYQGDGVSGMLMWGAQLEPGAFATPYIPTTSAAVTRTAPQLYVNTDPSWFNALEGTLFVASSRPAAGGIAKGVAGLAGVGGNYASIAYNASVTVLSGDIVTSSVSQTSQTVAAGASNSAALAYKTNDSAFSCNGSMPTTDTSVAVPAVTKLYVGDIDGTGYNANTRISKVAYWPKRIINTEQTALTTQ